MRVFLRVLVLLGVATLPFATPSTGAMAHAAAKPGEQAGEPAFVDLCEIPFTEAHRQALLTRHIPALRAIFSDWQATGAPTSTIGSMEKRELAHRVSGLEDIADDIVRAVIGNTAKAERAEIKPADTSLPKRAVSSTSAGGAANGLATNSDPNSFPLSLDQQAAIDAAAQALLHWACAMERMINVFLVRNFIQSLIGQDGSNAASTISWHDWLQWEAIFYSKTRRNPAPSAEDLQGLTSLTSDLLFVEFRADWRFETTKTERRRRLRDHALNWIMSSPADLTFKLQQVRNGLTSIRSEWSDERDVVAIMPTALSAYRSQVMLWAGQTDIDSVTRFELEYTMLEISALLLQPSLASCFLANLEDTGAQIRIDQKQAKARAGGLPDEFQHAASFIRLLEEAPSYVSGILGSNWKIIPSVERPCFRDNS